MKKSITISLFCLFNTVAIAQTDTSCLIHHYKFDGNYDDATKNKNHLTNFNSTLTKDRFGNSNMAVHLSAGQYLTGGTDSLPVGKSERTISIWLYLDIDPDSDVPVVWGSTAPAGAYGIILGTNLDYKGLKAMRHFAWGMSHDHGFLMDYPVQQWFHLATTYDGDTAKTYMNGKLIAYAARNWQTQKGNFYIGQNLNKNSNDRYIGAIDELQIYGCALSQTDISKLAQWGTSGIVKPASQFSIFPNPGNSALYIQSKGIINFVSIVNALGQQVYYTENNSSDYHIDTQSWKNGVYIINSFSQGGWQSCKWIKN